MLPAQPPAPFCTFEEALKHRTQTTRALNIGAVTIFFLTALFALVFFGSMTTAQVWFYFYFTLLAAYNTAFFAVPNLTRANWVKARRFTVYAPVAVLIILLIVGLIEFFRVLDGMNDITNNAYPVDPKDVSAERSYIALTLILYVFPALAQGVSFFAHANDLGLYLDDAKP